MNTLSTKDEKLNLRFPQKIPTLGYILNQNEGLHLSRFFIGYWILKRGWISILALFYFNPFPASKLAVER